MFSKFNDEYIYCDRTNSQRADRLEKGFVPSTNVSKTKKKKEKKSLVGSFVVESLQRIIIYKLILLANIQYTQHARTADIEMEFSL